MGVGWGVGLLRVAASRFSRQVVPMASLRVYPLLLLTHCSPPHRRHHHRKLSMYRHTWHRKARNTPKFGYVALPVPVQCSGADLMCLAYTDCQVVPANKISHAF